MQPLAHKNKVKSLPKLKNYKALLTFGLVGAALVALGGYRVLFNIFLLQNGKEKILADVVYSVSYLSVIVLLGSAGASAVFQRRTGEELLSKNDSQTWTALSRGALLCTLLPFLCDLIVRIGFALTGKEQIMPWWTLAVTGMLGLYAFVKPTSFTFGQQRWTSAVEITVLLAGLLMICSTNFDRPEPYLIILVGPQLLFALISFATISRDVPKDSCSSPERLSIKTNRNHIFWCSLGTTSSMGSVFMLNLLGRNHLSDLDYSYYGTLVCIIAALNIINRTLALMMTPHFTALKKTDGAEAVRKELQSIFSKLTKVALPFWIGLGITIWLLQTFAGFNIPKPFYAAAAILTFHTYMTLILGPLVHYCVGAGSFIRTGTAGAAGAVVALSFAALTLPILGIYSLAISLLMGSTTSYLILAVHFQNAKLINLFQSLKALLFGAFGPAIYFLLTWVSQNYN